MFGEIEITQLSKPSYNRYKTDRTLSNHNPNAPIKYSQFLRPELSPN